MNLYDEAIEELKILRDKAQREATAYGYNAVQYPNNFGFADTCRDRQAVHEYLRDIFDAAIKFTRQKRGLKVSDRMCVTGIRDVTYFLPRVRLKTKGAEYVY